MENELEKAIAELAALGIHGKWIVTRVIELEPGGFFLTAWLEGLRRGVREGWVIPAREGPHEGPLSFEGRLSRCSSR